MIIQEKAVLVNFTAKGWSARKYDRKVSKKIENIYNADSAGRYNKVLVAMDKLNEITQLVSAFRRYHYKMTMPWDNHCALLPSAHIMKYGDEERLAKEKHEKLVREFIDEYPRLKENAKVSLNGMYREEDYPPVEKIKGKFEFGAFIQPIADGNDFRVGVQKEELVRIKAEYAKREQEVLANGMGAIWQRTFDAVKHIADKLSEYNPDTKAKNSFRDTLIGNVVELVGLLPALNIIDDPKLEDMRRELEQRICTIQPENLRNDAQLRRDTAEIAKDMLKRMDGFSS